MKVFPASFWCWIYRLGINPFTFSLFIKEFPLYIRDYKELKKQMDKSKEFPIKASFPIFTDRNEQSGTMSGDYFHQDLFVARKIFENNPESHIDIGSRIDGFVAHVAVFREITIMDIRKQTSTVKNISFIQADLMKLPENMIDSCVSISSLHAIEHFGLGRYSDPIDFEGHIKALNNIHIMLKENGLFYFSVPIGKQRIEFNAHRVFSLPYLLMLFENKFKILSFSYVDDKGNFFENAELTDNLIKTSCGCDYAVYLN
ncbi:hypothetical protein FACS189451_01300 [Bacteroidia bacterium]|nr:hypothetical protein FACS189451_01300 [Bacteroidia bacterium]